MFLHQHSEDCIFGVKCKNVLCQFKHIGSIDNEIEEKQESKEVFCDLYCNRGYDCHRCS